MKIVNHTNWTTRSIRKFIIRAINVEFGAVCDARKRRNYAQNLEVEVVHTRGGTNGSSGYAWCNSYSMRVRVHPTNPDPIDFAHVICHELGHCRGERHRDMQHGNPRRYRTPGYRKYFETHGFGELSFVPKTVKEKKKETLEERRTAKIETAEAKILEWEKKKRFAETKIKTWKRKAYQLRYALKRAAQSKGEV